ncbi:MAG: hypothetical protein EXR07_11040 [Acetobacteraceae bacterium]|nr:hypothetical protein [Acetobacteraceae bacterium]
MHDPRCRPPVMSTAKIHAGSFSIPPDHPCLPGHMPGEPIVPGALLIDRALDLIAAHRSAPIGPGPLTVKFLLSVRPGDEIDLRYDVSRAGVIVFDGHVGKRLVFSGSLGRAS